MWIIEEGREGFRMNGFARIFINSTRFDMYGDCEAVSAYGYQSYTRKFYCGNSASGVVNNKELIEHIKRIAV